MGVDPLENLRRPNLDNTGQGERAEPRQGHTTAPVWVGQCLRLAGEVVPHALVLHQRDGKLTALSYGYLTAVRLSASTNIEIDFVGYAVAIGGRRLRAVFEAISTHKALDLAESKGQFDEEDEVPFIETISIVSTQER